ncbi:MAG: molecular chaperone HtpG, partial [Oscillospiraceae bacterium]|nr:molecular chaperone HtpG [Oscillospiraceae bacterium]
QFRKEAGESEDVDIIGQFGVGFYSAFMVADEITVVTRKYGSDKAYEWKSAGVDGYTVSECEKAEVGTDIVMHLKADTEDEKYGEYLETYRLRELIKKYSDYIRYPIRMLMPTSRVKEGSDPEKPEYETVEEMTTVNSMVPLWQRKRSEVTEEEYAKFYQELARDYEKPLRTITVSVEGNVTYKALMFVPGTKPMNFNTEAFEKGLQLYSAGVMIMDKCDALLPDYLRFVRGVVDSPDLSLNISRELLQHDRQLKVIAKNLEKKIIADLEKFLKEDREGYEKFYGNYARAIGYGVAGEGGESRRDELKDLLLFYSSTEKKLTTLREYVDRMPESQKNIYYAAGESVALIDALPQTELLKDKNYEVLYLTGEADEFVLQALQNYADKPFRSIVDGDLDLGEGDKQDVDEKTELMQFVKETLGDKVKEVKASHRLKTHPACMSAGQGLSFEMEKYFKNFDMPQPIHADRILELNTAHPSVLAMEEALKTDRDRAALYAKILYNQSLLIAGLPLDNPGEYTDMIAQLMK